MLQKQQHIQDTFLKLGPDLKEVAAPGPNPWPSLLCFAVQDHWQEVVVRRAARGFGVEGQIMFCHLSDMSVTPAAGIVDSQGDIVVPVINAYVGNWPWAARVESSPWSGNLPKRFYRQLTITAEWPRTYLDLARTMVKEKPASRNVQNLRKRMREGERPFLDSRKERGAYRDTVNSRSFNLLASLDRVSTNPIPAAVRGPAGTGNSPIHDDGLMALMTEFVSWGITVANGWRSWERWGGGGIEPDGMVRLNEGPFGAGWHYVEYERSARYRSRASKKLGRYLSKPESTEGRMCSGVLKRPESAPVYLG